MLHRDEAIRLSGSSKHYYLPAVLPLIGIRCPQEAAFLPTPARYDATGCLAPAPVNCRMDCRASMVSVMNLDANARVAPFELPGRAA